MKIYGIKSCDTMKKAFAWLEGNNISYEFHDYKKDGVPPGKLRALPGTRSKRRASELTRKDVRAFKAPRDWVISD